MVRNGYAPRKLQIAVERFEVNSSKPELAGSERARVGVTWWLQSFAVGPRDRSWSMAQRSRTVLLGSSPLVGIFGSIAVIGLLLVLAYEYRTPHSETPAAVDPAGAQPPPK